MIMSGKLLVSNAYTICSESSDITGVESDISWHDLIGDMEFTFRRQQGRPVCRVYIG